MAEGFDPNKYLQEDKAPTTAAVAPFDPNKYLQADAAPAQKPAYRQYTDPAVALGTGAARGATFGLSKFIEPDAIKKIAEEHPNYTTGGELASFLIPGAGPAMLAGKVGRGANALREANVIGGLGGKLAGGLINIGEGAVAGAADTAARKTVGAVQGENKASDIIPDAMSGAAIGGAVGGAIAPLRKAAESIPAIGKNFISRSIVRPTAGDLREDPDIVNKTIKYGITGGSREEIKNKAEQLMSDSWNQINSTAQKLDSKLSLAGAPKIPASAISDPLVQHAAETTARHGDDVIAKEYEKVAGVLGGNKEYSVSDLINLRKDRYDAIRELRPSASRGDFIDPVASNKIEANKAAISAIDDAIKNQASSLGDEGNGLYGNLKANGEKYGVGSFISHKQDRIAAAEGAYSEKGSNSSALHLLSSPVNSALNHSINDPEYVSGLGAAMTRSSNDLSKLNPKINPSISAVLNRLYQGNK